VGGGSPPRPCATNDCWSAFRFRKEPDAPGGRGCGTAKCWGKKMRQFSIGEVVTWVPDLLLRSESHGDYRIVGEMPDRDGDHIYRIKSPLEEYERVVKESLLVRSQGCLPEEIVVRRLPARSVTLPNLLQVSKRATH
jgi:hypothetical protein